MLKQFCTDLRRGLRGGRFALAAALGAAAYVLGVLPEGAGSIPYLLDAPIAFGNFNHLFPLAALLPLVSAFPEDVKSGYAKFCLQRVPPWKYLLGRFCACVLLSGLALAAGMLLYVALLPLLKPGSYLPTGEAGAAVYQYMEDYVLQGRWPEYFGFYALLQLLNGAMWGSVGMLLAGFMESTQLIYLAAVLSQEVICRLLFALGKNHIVVYAVGMLEEATARGQVLESVLSVMGSVVLVCFAGYCLLAKRRLRHV